MSARRLLAGLLLLVPVSAGAAPPEPPPSLLVLPSSSPPLARLTVDLLRLSPGALVHLERGPGAVIEVVDLSPELRRHFGAPADRGVLVSRVHRREEGERPAIEVGDVLLTLDDRPVTGEARWRELLLRGETTQPARVELLRNGATLHVDLPSRRLTVLPRALTLPEGLPRALAGRGPLRVLSASDWTSARVPVERALGLASRAIADPEVQRRFEDWQGRLQRSEGELAKRVAELERRIAELERELGR